MPDTLVYQIRLIQPHPDLLPRLMLSDPL